MLAGKLRGKTGSATGVSISSFYLSALGPGPETIAYQLESSGICNKVDGGFASSLETWLLSGAASSYEVRVTDLDGNLTSGTTGVWLPLSSTREWSITEGSPGASVSTRLTVEIRMAGSPFTVLDTETVTLNVFIF